MYSFLKAFLVLMKLWSLSQFYAPKFVFVFRNTCPARRRSWKGLCSAFTYFRLCANRILRGRVKPTTKKKNKLIQSFLDICVFAVISALDPSWSCLLWDSSRSVKQLTYGHCFGHRKSHTRFINGQKLLLLRRHGYDWSTEMF